MSTLTKVFVVTLVLLSLLLAAASVTLLSTVPDYSTKMQDLTQARDAAVADNNRRSAADAAQRAALQDQATTLQGRLDSAGDQSASLRAQLLKAEADKAALQGQLAQAQATQAQLSEAVSANTALSNELRQQVTTLRGDYDSTLQQYAELNSNNSKTSQELEFTRRQLRQAQEELKDAQNQSAQLGNLLKQNGVSPERLAQGAAGGPISAPPINGVVLGTLQSGGAPYAQISVGSEDDVQQGMRFTVLSSRGGDFLGFLTIESVNDTVSIGRLSGPKINQISVNDSVRTQVDAVSSAR